jgi:CRISPR-associated protein Cas5t
MEAGSTKKRVVRVRITAPTTSFRYSHFLIGRQITFRMPPPSTIYGHVASALGYLPEPGSFEFAYDFRYRALASDLEHQQIVTAGGRPFEVEGVKYPKAIEATVQPHFRDFLYAPELTLYLTNLDLANAFRSPVFCVVLGRSQDLACIERVDEVELVAAAGAYFEHLLLPFSWRSNVSFGATVLMPRYIAPAPERQTQFERYIALEDTLWGGAVEDQNNPPVSKKLMSNPVDTYWADPDTPSKLGVSRGVVFHSFLSK